MPHPRWLNWARALSFIFVLDGVLAVGFGVASLLAPRQTFGTIVDLSNASDASLIFAALASVSGLYVLIGLLAFVIASVPLAYRQRFALPMIASHAWIGWKGFNGIGSEWLIGNPWPDIVIHSAFIVAYLSITFASGFCQRTDVAPAKISPP